MILIAGPCVLESRDNVMRIAEELGKYHDDCTKEFYFKASFDKANRTSLESFRGPGLDEGLKMLQEVKDQFGYRILTDIHDYTQPAAAAEVAADPCIFMSSDRSVGGSSEYFGCSKHQKGTVSGTCSDGTLCS